MLIDLKKLFHFDVFEMLFFIPAELREKMLEGLLAKTFDELEVVLFDAGKDIPVNIKLPRDLAKHFPHAGPFVMNTAVAARRLVVI